MPGFLSAYDGTERIDLGRGYWAEVKCCLSYAEQQRAQAKMGAGRQSVDLTGRQFAVIDMNAFETEMLVLSLVDWNLDDDAGNIWPLTPDKALRESVAKLPASVASKIYEVCNRLNGPQDSREVATFPGEDLGGGEGWDGGAAGVGVVPDPEGFLGEIGPDGAGVVDAPVA